MKPSNIFLLNEGRPWKFKVTDFGIGTLGVDEERARELTLSDPGRQIYDHTYAYASPEQRDKSNQSEPSDDVHALGVIWCELLWYDHDEFEQLFHCFGPPNYKPNPPKLEELRQVLINTGMTSEQIELIESCVGTKKQRPENAGVLANRIRELFPICRYAVLEDAAAVERLRAKDKDCTKKLAKMCDEKWSVWQEGVNHKLPEAGWLACLCAEHGIVDGNPCSNPVLFDALDLFARAAEDGFAPAQFDKGLMALSADGGLSQLFYSDRPGALRWLRRAADNGHAEAAHRLSVLLGEAKGVDAFVFLERKEYASTGVAVGISRDSNGDPHFAWFKRPPDGEYEVISLRSDSHFNVSMMSEGEIHLGIPSSLFVTLSIANTLRLSPLAEDVLNEWGLVKLGDLLDHSMAELSDALGADVFAEVASALADLWLDPWKLCSQKSREYGCPGPYAGNLEGQPNVTNVKMERVANCRRIEIRTSEGRLMEVYAYEVAKGESGYWVISPDRDQTGVAHGFIKGVTSFVPAESIARYIDVD